jgi:hypothetical protein
LFLQRSSEVIRSILDAKCQKKYLDKLLTCENGLFDFGNLFFQSIQSASIIFYFICAIERLFGCIEFYLSGYLQELAVSAKSPVSSGFIENVYSKIIWISFFAF